MSTTTEYRIHHNRALKMAHLVEMARRYGARSDLTRAELADQVAGFDDAQWTILTDAANVVFHAHHAPPQHRSRAGVIAALRAEALHAADPFAGLPGATAHRDDPEAVCTRCGAPVIPGRMCEECIDNEMAGASDWEDGF